MRYALVNPVDTKQMKRFLLTKSVCFPFLSEIFVFINYSCKKNFLVLSKTNNVCALPRRSSFPPFCFHVNFVKLKLEVSIKTNYPLCKFSLNILSGLFFNRRPRSLIMPSSLQHRHEDKTVSILLNA